MADDADVAVPDITPEDFDGEQAAPKAEPSPAKESAKADEKEPEVVKATKEAKAEKASAIPDVPTKAEEPKSDEAKPEEAQPEEAVSLAEDKPPTKAEERKSQLNTEIRDLVSQRNALKAEVEKANAEVYQPATEDELVSEGLSATDAKVEALRQQIEVRDYNEKVADAQLTLSSESQRVLQDFSIFNPNSEDFDKELSQEAAVLMDANLIRDPNTKQVIGSNFPLYELYKTLARASGISTVKGQLKGQQDTEKMLANADVTSSAAPPKKAVDPVIALWESDD